MNGRKALSLIKTVLNLIQRLIALLFPFSAMEESREAATAVAPAFDPVKPSVPISYPIKTLEGLLSKSYFDSFHFPFNRSSVRLPLQSSLPSRPRILVCHDMAGGYTDDRWVQGGTNPDAYAIWHWHLIDVFVYFSHNLVTIPPPCWTNTAHTHGVKVLGTFIMEPEEGEVIAKKLLATKDSAKVYAELLKELALALGFDGWLINMEVSLDADLITNLIEFVSHLTTSMHASLPGSLVIWYDSVTKDGELRWQNQLNEYNKPFFDICDGIFTNYFWEENYPKLSAAFAGERKFDVYMGIDVFGRNTYGGGQWTTNVALDVLKKDSVSAAIFAPGWVYEKKEKPDFQTAQDRWWGLVEKSWGTLNYYPIILPFYSNFDQGHGYHIFLDGVQLAGDPWNNISCQTLQPVLDVADNTRQSNIQVSRNFKDPSYSGGGSITFTGNLEGNASYISRLFRGNLNLKDQKIYVSHTAKTDGNSQLGLALNFLKLNVRTSIFLATGKPLHWSTNKFDEVVMPLQVSSSATGEGTEWNTFKHGLLMNDSTLTDIHIVCYRDEKPNTHLDHESEIGKGASSSPELVTFNASLGHLSIRTSPQDMEYPNASDWIVHGQDVSWVSGSQGDRDVSLKINWNISQGTGETSLFSKYNVYVEKIAKTGEDGNDGLALNPKYIGVAMVQAFYVSNLTVVSNIARLKFIIQVCGIDGSFQSLKDSPSFMLDVDV